MSGGGPSSAARATGSTAGLAQHLLTLATLRLLTVSPDARFTHVGRIPLQVLSELTARYLELLGSKAKSHAEQAGRTQASAKDVVHAMEDFGSHIGELWDWCEDRRLGGEGIQMAATGPVHPASLGALMKEAAKTSTRKQPSQVIEYRPLNELEEFEYQQAQAGTALDLPISLPEGSSSPPPAYNEVVRPKRDILDYLPPIPDLTQDTVQTIEEDESGRTIKRARRNIDSTAGKGAGAWQRITTYETSALAEFETKPLPSLLLTESSDLVEDQAASSSLYHFLETLNFMSMDAQANPTEPLLLRQNKKRRLAATAIQSNITLNPSDDTLSGNVPTPQPRHAKKQAGWIPYPPSIDRDDPSEPSGKAVQAFPPLHPFSTALPVSMTEPVPVINLPHLSRTWAPGMHPRYSTAHGAIRTYLEGGQPALFNRATRLGPPGPLLENGAAGYYDVEAEKPNILGWPAETLPRMMSWNFDWEMGNENEPLRTNTAAPAPTTTYTSPSIPMLPQKQGARQASEQAQMAPVEPAAPADFGTAPSQTAGDQSVPSMGAVDFSGNGLSEPVDLAVAPAQPTLPQAESAPDAEVDNGQANAATPQVRDRSQTPRNLLEMAPPAQAGQVREPSQPATPAIRPLKLSIRLGQSQSSTTTPKTAVPPEINRVANSPKASASASPAAPVLSPVQPYQAIYPAPSVVKDEPQAPSLPAVEPYQTIYPAALDSMDGVVEAPFNDHPAEFVMSEPNSIQAKTSPEQAVANHDGMPAPGYQTGAIVNGQSAEGQSML